MGSLYRRGGAGNWQAKFTGPAGVVERRSTRTTSKNLAKQLLAKWEHEANQRRMGLANDVGDRLQRFSFMPLQQHVDDWIETLANAGKDRKHISQLRGRVERAAAAARWRWLSDLAPEGLSKRLSAMRLAGESNQTIAHHISANRQFVRWAIKTGRLIQDPFATIEKPKASIDRKLERRMLLPAEWVWLARVSGSRRLIYEVAIQTGLRASELRQVRPSDCFLLPPRGYLVAQAETTKNAECARQYFSESLRLRLLESGPHSSSRQFNVLSDHYRKKRLLGDLAAARELWLSRDGVATMTDHQSDFLQPINAAGEVLDFHSLRHTCGAWLAIRGVHPGTIQAVMRHSTITLTMDTYGHLFPEATAEAVDRIGELTDVD